MECVVINGINDLLRARHQEIKEGLF